MPRISTIDTHPKRTQIVSDLVRGVSFRSIATRYGVSTAALQRHLKGKLAERAAATKAALAIQEGDYLMQEVDRQRAYITKILEACDRWLSDPADPSRYSMDITHPDDIVVAYDVAGGTEAKPTRKTVKVRLTELLPLIEQEDLRSDVRLVEIRRKDIREVMLRSMAELRGYLALLAEIEGKIRNNVVFQFNSPVIIQMQALFLEATKGHPEVRQRFIGLLKALPETQETSA